MDGFIIFLRYRFKRLPLWIGHSMLLNWRVTWNYAHLVSTPYLQSTILKLCKEISILRQADIFQTFQFAALRNIVINYLWILTHVTHHTNIIKIRHYIPTRQEKRKMSFIKRFWTLNFVNVIVLLLHCVFSFFMKFNFVSKSKYISL